MCEEVMVLGVAEVYEQDGKKRIAVNIEVAGV